MRYFNVPFYFDEEEKIVGGRMSLRQLGYMALGVLAGLIAWLILPAPMPVKAVFSSTFVMAAAVVAFWKLPKHNMGLDEYMRLAFSYRRREKEFPFRGRG